VGQSPTLQEILGSKPAFIGQRVGQNPTLQEILGSKPAFIGQRVGQSPTLQEILEVALSFKFFLTNKKKSGRDYLALCGQRYFFICVKVKPYIHTLPLDNR